MHFTTVHNIVKLCTCALHIPGLLYTPSMHTVQAVLQWL
jgi:hypothetical protein